MDGGHCKRSIGQTTDDRSITKTELPPELVVTDILSRLPLKTCVRCRCVSKCWLNLLLDPNFAKVHLSRSPVQFLLQSYTPVNLILVELDKSSIISKHGDQLLHVSPKSVVDFKTYTKIHRGSSRVHILNSCNGVLCLIIKSPVNRFRTFASGKSLIDGYPFHIYNPVTGEHLVVPQMETDSFIPIAGGLGYSGKTNDFKLLRFLQSKTNQDLDLDQDLALIREADIHTIGSNTWRRIEISTCSRLKFSNSAPFLNGALHWITYGDDDGNDELISSFDFEEEKFRPLPTPDHFDGIDLKGTESEIGTLGGSLCLCFRPSCGFPLDIWLMNEYGVKQSWSKLFVVDNPIHSFVGGTVKLFDNGDILLMGIHGLILCNRRTKIIRHVSYDITSGIMAQIPHVPSFVRVLKQD